MTNALGVRWFHFITWNLLSIPVCTKWWQGTSFREEIILRWLSLKYNDVIFYF